MNLTYEKISGDISENLCRLITDQLPEYFGLPEANEHYALGVRTKTNFAAKMGGDYIGLLSVDFPYPNNSNIYWMAINPNCHCQGIGKQLLRIGEDFASTNGAQTMTVETLAPNASDENYLKTYNFYLNCGFVPLFNLKPQGYECEMVYMCKILKKI